MTAGKAKRPHTLPNGVRIADADGSYRKWVSDSKRRQTLQDWQHLQDTPAARTAQSAGLSDYRVSDCYKASRIAAWALWKARQQGRIAANETPDTAAITGEQGRDGFAYLVTFYNDAREVMHRVLVPDWPAADSYTDESEARDAA